MDEKGRIPGSLLIGVLVILSSCAPGESRTVDIYRPSSPRISVQLEGRTNIECRATYPLSSEKFVSLGWQYVADNSISTVNINRSDFFNITNRQEKDYSVTSSLTIHNITYSMEGYYYCHLVTTGGEESDFVEVRVQGVPYIVPTYSTPTGAIEGVLGESLEIKCYVKARPEALITWYKDNTAILNTLSSRYTIDTLVTQLDIDTESVLRVFSLSREDLGRYECRANNSKGTTQTKWSVKATPFLSITDPSSNNTNTNYGYQISIKCRAGNFADSRQIKWYFHDPFQSKREVKGTFDSRFSIYTWEDTTGGVNSQLTVIEVGFEDEGWYSCESGDLTAVVWINVIGRPVIVASTTTLTVLPDASVTLTCDIQARPKATLVGWFFNTQMLGNTSRYEVVTRIGQLNSRTTLIVHRVEVGDYGNHLSCKAVNSHGEGQVFINIKDVNECETGANDCDTNQHETCVDTLGSYTCQCAPGYEHNSAQGHCKDEDECAADPGVCSQTCVNTPGSYRCTCRTGYKLASDQVACLSNGNQNTDTPTASADTGKLSSAALGVAIGIPIVLLVIIAIIVFLVCRHRKDKRRELIDVPKAKPTPSRGFYNTAYHVEGDEAHIYTELASAGDEFPRGRLRFLNSLGEGKFGRVVKAEALSITMNGKWEEVAVKMVKETATDSLKEDFYHELTIVRKIPAHRNVVTYLGCVTSSDPILIIMEYVNGGDLLSYLRNRRPENIRSNPQHHQNDLTPKDLLSFALQIARGMAHVAANKIIHRDVAARNVLIDRKHVCKVSDFGLARDVDGADVYERTNRGPLPIRWMAPECLRDSVHTTKSDVWAFGVLLWEIVTLGASPYPGMSGQMVMAAVMEGKRLLCPPQCKQEVYNIMLQCWNTSPDSRPSFSSLSRDFERLLEEEGDYIQLDHIEEGIYQVLDGTRSEELL